MLKPNKNSKFTKIRKGRGNSSGKGGECGRGHKGQRSRSGFSQMSGFEGGQNPLYKRIPKKRGHKNRPLNKIVYQIVNLDTINTHFNENDDVSPQTLFEKKICNLSTPIKILGRGKLTINVNFKDLKFSKSCKQILGLTESNT